MTRSHRGIGVVTASLFGLWLTSCAAPSDPPADGPRPIDELATWMEGSFDSSAQAARDPQNYLDVHLSMTRIFLERDDGPWLYVEQAVSSALDRPYRQRVYRLVALDDGHVRSEVYTLPGDPLTFAGADAAKLAALSPDTLVAREGCAIELERVGPDAWRGSTQGRGCASNLANASYATSEVVITSTMLKSWDRGFDSADHQVWGASGGPYEFVKNLPAAEIMTAESGLEESTDSETTDPDGG